MKLLLLCVLCIVSSSLPASANPVPDDAIKFETEDPKDVAGGLEPTGNPDDGENRFLLWGLANLIFGGGHRGYGGYGHGYHRPHYGGYNHYRPYGGYGGYYYG